MTSGSWLRAAFLAVLTTLLICVAASPASAQADEDIFAAPEASETFAATDGPTIKSDQEDYAPGATVVLNGSGWQPGEAVTIVVNDDGLSEEPWRREVVVTADTDGYIQDSFELPPYFVANYYVTATGESSGTATTTFTDAVNTTTSLTSSANPSTSGQSVTFTATVTRLDTNGPATVGNLVIVANGNSSCGGGGAVVLASGTPNSSGQVTATTSSLSAGNTTVRACYTGTGGSTGTTNSTSSPLTQVVNSCAAPSVTTNPSTQSITYGANAQFTAAASGTPNPSVRWQRNVSGVWSDISGATSSTLSVTKPAVSDTGTQYRAVFTNNCGGTATATTTAATLNVARKNLTVSGASGQNKVYDRSVSAGVDYSGATLNGVESGDTVTLNSSGYSATFANASVGNGKPITVTGVTLAGASAGNYTVSQPSGLTANITAKNLTVAGAVAQNKTYDGSSAATVSFSSASLSGVESGDTVNLVTSGYSANFNNANAGSNKPVTVSGVEIAGSSASNYTVSQPAGLTADIAKAGSQTTLTWSGSTYNGSPNSASAQADGIAGEDDLAPAPTIAYYPGAAIESGETALAGAPTDAGTYTAKATFAGNPNYNGSDDTKTITIARKNLTIDGADAEDKDYDGSRTASVDFSVATLVTPVPGDDVTIDSSGYEATFDSKDAGTDKSVTVTGVAVGGAQAGNYSVSQPSGLKAAVDKRMLTVTGITAADKEYDGDRDADLDTTGAQLENVVPSETVGLDTSAAVGLFNTKNVGEDKPVQISGLTLTGAAAVLSNYSLTQPATTASITQAELLVNAADASVAYDQPYPAPEYTLSGFTGSDTKDNVTITGAASCSIDLPANSDAGKYEDVISCGPGTLGSLNYSFAAGSKADLTITKASTALTYSGDATEQYSDETSLRATLLDGAKPVVGKTITFTIGSQSTTGETNSDGVATATLKITQPAATTTVASSFAGDDNYAGANDSDPFTITKEDARAYYTGALFASTSSPSSSGAIVTLSATVKDITAVAGSGDSSPGDIRNASLRFVHRETGAEACTAAVGLVDLTDTETGTATCNWPVNIGSQDSQSYTIDAQVVGNHYTGDNSGELAVVTVSKPLTAFITGGGYLTNVSSGGQYAGDAGKKTNFGFNVKYNKSKTNLQGNINTIIRRGAKTYQIKGNSMTSLATKMTTPTTGTATFNGKANIQDITNPLAVESVDGNATLQVVMTDAGDPGRNDTIAITVWNKSGGMWFSSNWTGTKTLEQLLGGGNLVVR